MSYSADFIVFICSNVYFPLEYFIYKSCVVWHEMHYLCRGYVYMNYFSVCDTKFKWLKKCLFNFFECFPFLSVPSLDFSLFFMHKKTNLFLIHLVCKNFFQLPFAQPTVLSFVHNISCTTLISCVQDIQLNFGI